MRLQETWARINPVTPEEWQQFSPGSRMYKGKKTLFYNGEQLWDRENFLVYNEEERDSWDVIIVLDGVEIIREHMFSQLEYLEMVIMSDSVIRIEAFVFLGCEKLRYVRLSTNLEFIGPSSFEECDMYSLFVPPSCTEICERAFYKCTFLRLLNVSQNTEIATNAIAHTTLIKQSPFFNRTDANEEEVLEWIKNVNGNEEYELHRACSLFNPLPEIIYMIVRRKGLGAFKKKNELYLTPIDYLEENPFVQTEINQIEIMKRYVLEMSGISNGE